MQSANSSPELGSSPFQWREFFVSLALYVAFAAAVFLVMGSEPLLGSDHLTYMRLADEIAEANPDGHYFGQINSVRSFSVMLAWLQPFTQSYVLSMKLILAVVSVAYLLAAELLLSLFTPHRWTRRLFALLAAFAVSFGVASWGITDYTALMPRTVVMPVVFFSVWFYFRFFERTWRYAVFPLLVLFSILHLSTFYLLGVFIIFEAFDFWFIRRRRIDLRLLAFPGWLCAALLLLVALQRTGVSIGATSYLASMLFRGSASTHAAVSKGESTRRTGTLNPPGKSPGTSAAPLPDETPRLETRTLWHYELMTRAWRNMPLPLVNVANIFSSFALILLLGLAGAWIAFRSTRRPLDVSMACWVPANLLFALGPQTTLWLLRQFSSVPPLNIEEIRALSFLMIPALYFGLRLFEWLGAQDRRTAVWGRPTFVVLYLVLPLTMKSLTPGVREKLLSAMVSVGGVESNPTAVSNARAALGLTYAVPLHYPVQGIDRWLTVNGHYGSLVLTDRDDILARHFLFVGSHQEVALQDFFENDHARAVLQIYQELKQALAAHDLDATLRLARRISARYVIVPWPVEKAAYRDEHFSLLDVTRYDFSASPP